MPSRYKPKTKKYYLRMFSSGVWYFLLRVTHDKQARAMKPVWWPERMKGASQPYLFKTMIGARNAQTNYVTDDGATSEIKEWEGGAAGGGWKCDHHFEVTKESADGQPKDQGA